MTSATLARGVPDIDLLRALAATNRKALERMIAVSIDILDQTDPDPDLEEDDPSGVCDEDGANTGMQHNALNHRVLEGPGCVLSDDDVDEVYRPLWQTPEGRDFVNARRASLGILPIRRRC
ncbi:hypothetical protein [Sphingopyxis granuli]|uniref:hypothetical protein n=1 Tax=Sphingopyxis granuli TaxID=267128 RepID=UPI001BAED736|nr:hypothetical protein [Sphingopyxis granuli]QUM70855.1 hypothetical protein ICN83_10615 [Sphingopyxis granuli]